MNNKMTASEVIDRYFLEARGKILDLAAILDRIDRGEGEAIKPLLDKRLRKLREAINSLDCGKPERARRVQMIFSLAYEEKHANMAAEASSK